VGRFAQCCVACGLAIDGGPILAQPGLPVEPVDTHDTLAARVHAAEQARLPSVIDRTAELRPGQEANGLSPSLGTAVSESLGGHPIPSGANSGRFGGERRAHSDLRRSTNSTRNDFLISSVDKDLMTETKP
jgi:hypothetical protein